MENELQLLRVFLDSSVFVAAAGSDKGSRSASVSVLLCAELGLIQLVTSETVVEEVENNIRKKISSKPNKRTGLDLYNQIMGRIQIEIVPDPTPEMYKRWADVTDPKDAPIIGAAVTAQVDYLLSLNTKHFTQKVSELAGIPFPTPGQFMQMMRFSTSQMRLIKRTDHDSGA